MSYKDKISNIIDYIKTAEIKVFETTTDYLKVYDKPIHPFYEYQVRENNSCVLPKYAEIVDYLFSQRTSENFFSEINLTLNKIEDFLNTDGYYEAIYLTKKINILVEKSFKVISKMYEIFDLKLGDVNYKFSNIIYSN